MLAETDMTKVGKKTVRTSPTASKWRQTRRTRRPLKQRGIFFKFSSFGSAQIGEVDFLKKYRHVRCQKPVEGCPTFFEPQRRAECRPAMIAFGKAVRPD